MNQEIDVMSFTVFEENRVMDFIIPVRSTHKQISAQLGKEFGESCKVIAHSADLL